MADNMTSWRSSPRKRRRVARLGIAGALAVTLVVLLVFVLPNTAGKPQPRPEMPAGYGSGPFWWVATALFVGFLLVIALGIVRFFWRMHRDDTEPAATEGNEWRMLPHPDGRAVSSPTE
jgi:hypothetical protein